jgi:hypothetical protein
MFVNIEVREILAHAIIVVMDVFCRYQMRLHSYSVFGLMGEKDDAWIHHLQILKGNFHLVHYQT